MSDQQPVGSEPWAIALLTALLFLLAAVLVIELGGCMPEPPVNLGPVQTQVVGQRSSSWQEIYSVQVLSLCLTRDDNTELTLSMGSGVVMDSNHVLTANHVVSCDGDVSVTVRTAWGRSAWMTVQKANRAADVARLVSLVDGALSSDEYPATRPHIGLRPVPGETVCAVSSMPRRTRSCGEVRSADYLPRLYTDELKHNLWNSDVFYSGKVRHGNSGGGVYDLAGNLVGVVTELDPFHAQGGRFTSLEAHEDLTGP